MNSGTAGTATAAATASTAASTDFGQLILERKNGAKIWAALTWGLALILGTEGAFMLNASVPKVELAATLFAVAVVLMVAPFFLPNRVLRFHERGLTERLPLRGVFPLRYEDLEHMKWRAVKPSVGVLVEAELLGAGRRITFSARMDTGGRFQQNVEGLRDRIAPYVAARVRRQIQANQPFAWGSERGASVRLLRDGIAYRPVRFVGRGDEQLIPWTTPLDFAIRDGWLAVFPSAGTEALFTLACEAPDFYPGLLAFIAMGRTRRL